MCASRRVVSLLKIRMCSLVGGGGGGGAARLLRLAVSLEGPPAEAATRAAVYRGLTLGGRRWEFLHGKPREGLALFLAVAGERAALRVRACASNDLRVRVPFAVAGAGLPPLTVEDLRAWAIPRTPGNARALSLCKYAARMDMAFSDTARGPAVRDLVCIADVRAGPGCACAMHAVSPRGARPPCPPPLRTGPTL